MAEEKSPIICVTCQREFPDDLKAENAPKYFAQHPLLPRSDSARDFGSEAWQICAYIKAISEIARYGENKEIEEPTYDMVFELVRDLSAEAMRRQELAMAALDEIWRRDHGKEAPTQEEGRA